MERTNGKGSPIHAGGSIQSTSASHRAARSAALGGARCPPGGGVGVRYCAGVPGSARPSRARPASAWPASAPERAVPLAPSSARRTEVAAAAAATTGESRREMPLLSLARRVETVRAAAPFFSTPGSGRLAGTRVGCPGRRGGGASPGRWMSTVTGGDDGGPGTGVRAWRPLPRCPPWACRAVEWYSRPKNTRHRAEGDAGCWVRRCTNNRSRAGPSPEP